MTRRFERFIGDLFDNDSEREELRAFVRREMVVKAHLHPDSPRAAAWEHVFGGLSVPLVGVNTILMMGPHGMREFYQVDVAALTAEQRARLVDHIAEKFTMPRQEVETGIDDPTRGLPILVEDVSLTLAPKWLR